MRAAGTPPLHIAGRAQEGVLQLHGGVVQPPPPPFWHPLPIPDCLRDADTQGNPNDLSDKPSIKPGQLQPQVRFPPIRPFAIVVVKGQLWVPQPKSKGRAQKQKPCKARSQAGYCSYVI